MPSLRSYIISKAERANYYFPRLANERDKNALVYPEQNSLMAKSLLISTYNKLCFCVVLLYIVIIIKKHIRIVVHGLQNSIQPFIRHNVRWSKRP